MTVIKSKQTLSDLVAQYHHHVSTINSVRLKAAAVLVELRWRIENGEDGGYYKTRWWEWFEKHVQRSRGDAEKLLAIGGSKNPEAAAQEERERNRTYKQLQRERERAAAAVPADVSGSEPRRFIIRTQPPQIVPHTGVRLVFKRPDDDSDDGDVSTPEMTWRRGFMYRAKESLDSAAREDWAAKGLSLTLK
jgi:hypothetical protein